MDGKHETPTQEAVSIITIVAILVSVGCYVMALQNAPVVAPALLWLARLVYHWFPLLSALSAPQMPFVVASATVGTAFFVLSVPFAGLLAAWFNAAGIASLERSTRKLNAARKRIRKRRRERDGFNAQ